MSVGQNDYYGSNYASFPLSSFRRWIQNESSSPHNFGDELDRGADTDASPSGASSEGGGEDEKERARVVIPMTSSFRCDLLEEAFVDDATREQLLAQSSSFSVDINPRLLLASEELVEVLITSGVGRYLEFAAIENTYVLLSKGASTGTASEPAEDAVWEVPCSKKDVFQSKLLGMVEKRQLMKFLQFVADYGETHIKHEDVTTKNERSLALGRALQRPQNKASQVTSDVISPYLDGPFQELLERHFKLSPKLQEVVVYCVALASFPVEKEKKLEHHQQMTARDGLAAVYRYVSSIGRFTGTAFLVPLYGVSEIAQSFCRLCAVYGGIYVLRAPIDGFVVDSQSRNVVGIRCTDGGMVRAKQAVVVNGSYLECLKSWKHLSTDEYNDGDEASEGAAANPAHGKVLRGVFLLNASLRGTKSRIILAIPPHDAKLKNPFAVQVVQADYGAYVCPRGYYLVHVSMSLPSDWSEDSERQHAFILAVMEELANSALAQQASTKKDRGEGDALESGTSVSPDGTSDSSAEASTESNAEAPSSSSAGPVPPQPVWKKLVVWHTIFTMDHLTASGASVASERKRSSSSGAGREGESTAATATALPSVSYPGLPGNVWVCETAVNDAQVASCAADAADTAHRLPVHPLEMHLESASANARAIFEQLCPGEAFLPKSASAEQAEQEELAGEEDAVLEAAQKLAQSATLAAAPASAGDGDGSSPPPSLEPAATTARDVAHSP